MALRNLVEGIEANTIKLFNNTRSPLVFTIEEQGSVTGVSVSPLSAGEFLCSDFVANPIFVREGTGEVVAESPAGNSGFIFYESNSISIHSELELARHFVQGFISLTARDSMTTWMVRKVTEIFVLSAKGQASLSAAALVSVAPDFEKMRLLDEWEQACLNAAKSGDFFPDPPAFLSSYVLEF